MASASVIKGIPVARRGRKATELLGASRAATGVITTPVWLLLMGLWLVIQGSKEGFHAL